MKIRIIAFILLISILLPVSYSKAEEIGFYTSYDDSNNVQITTKDRSLVIDFPDKKQYERSTIRLLDDDGTEYNVQWYETFAPIEYSLNNLQDGIYYLQIYIQSDSDGLYWSYIHGEAIKLKLSNDSIEILMPEVYKRNLERYNSRKNDKLTLQYYLQPSHWVESDNEKLISLASEITEGIENDYDKIRAIHDWVCNNIYYDFDALYGYGELISVSALETFDSRRSVCQGYASITAALLRASGFPTKVVSGYAFGVGVDSEWNDDIISSGETNHAWNEVYVSDRWIIIDTTWNSNNRYLNKEFSDNTGLRNYKYFDISIELFSSDHLMVSDDSEADEYAAFYYIDKAKVTPTKKTLYLNKPKKKTVAIKTSISSDAKELGYKISYKSKNPKIAKVSKKGKVTAISKGKATISTTIQIGDNKKTFITAITVK
jgi:transglutaminase-like putative cysteine protease